MDNWREISDTIILYNSIEKISVHFRVKYVLSLECGSIGGGGSWKEALVYVL